MEAVIIKRGITAGPAARAVSLCAAFAAVFLSAALFLPASSPAAVPVKITYQGNLRQAGNLVTGQRNIVFRIYNSSTAAVALWTSATYPVDVSTGIFKVDLQPVLADWETGNLWLELEIDGVRLSPRDEMTAAPYAVNSLLHSGKRYTTTDTAPASPTLGDLWFDTGSNGLRYWSGTAWIGVGPGDNLGNHTATMNLNLAGFQVYGAAAITASSYTATGALGIGAAQVGFAAGVSASSAAAAQYGGLYVSTHVYTPGNIYAAKFYGDISGASGLPVGDNLGSHIATKDLNMASFNIVNVSSISYLPNVYLASATAADYGGLYVSSNVYTPGDIHAAKFYGDISGASGLPVGDNLGSHTATQDLNLAQHSAVNVASISMVGAGLQIGTDLTSSANGLFVSTAGAIVTIGLGNGLSAPNARGFGAVDLQTVRLDAVDVASGAYAAILGGMDNIAAGEAAAVGGGEFNHATGSLSTVSGGNTNKASGYISVVSGGFMNTASGSDSTVSGGSTNQAKGDQSAVSGGQQNMASGNLSVASGGFGNTASGAAAVISGGESNKATANYATVSGGNSNQAIGANSTVPGGVQNSAVGDYSYAGGFYSSSTAHGAFTWSDSAGPENDNTVADRTLFKNGGGFLVTGSTNTNMTGVLDRGIFVTGTGLVGISTGTPGAALDVVSSGVAQTDMVQIWRDSGGVIVGSMSATGVLMAAKLVGGASIGDNLGDHTATKDLNLSGFDLVGVSTITISSVTTAGAGVIFSTNVYFMNGNVGIGTAGPAGPFQVGANSLAVSNAGSVGIGTSSPNYKLHVQDGRIVVKGTGATLTVKNGGGSENALSAESVASFDNEQPAGVAVNMFAAPGKAASLYFGDTPLPEQGAIKYLINDFAPNTQYLSFNVNSAERLRVDAAGNVGISSATPMYRLVVSSGAGEAGNMLVISTGTATVIRMTGAGEIYANKLYGDISGATGLPSGDNLGDHIATTTLQMGIYGINSSSAITAAYYQIAGSTVLAILPGAGLAVGYEAGKINTGTNNSFVGYQAGAANTTGTSNIFAGWSAGASNTSGANNSFVGAQAGIGNTTGNLNSFFGISAGINNTTGLNNSFMGAQAGAGNTTGGSNAYVGYNSGYFSKTGSANAILGTEAGLGTNGSSFSNATLVGYHAGYGLSSGSDNILLGWQAGSNIQTGADNIVIGYNQDVQSPAANSQLNIGGLLFGDLAAKTIGISTRSPQAALDIVSTGTASNIYAQIWRNGSGVEVASITSQGVLYATMPPGSGDNLGSHIATKDLNMSVFNLVNVGSITANGAITTYSSVTAAGNLAVSTIIASGDITAARYQVNGSTVIALLPGTGSMGVGSDAGKLNSGSYNSFFGYQAGAGNTTAQGNTYVGYYAGLALGGSFNTFVGNTAGYLNQGGANSFFGSLAGYHNLGSSNSFFGDHAGYENTTGANNSFLGYGAGQSNTTGASNTFSGLSAGADNFGGSSNSAFGTYAALYNVAGSANTVFGFEAGRGVFQNSFSSSTILGYQAGYNLTTGSADNILLGWRAGYNIDVGTGNIVIGYEKYTSAPGANNELVIGGLLYGDLSAKTIGISTRSPAAALDIVSTGTAANIYAQIWRNGSGVEVASMTSQGMLYATLPPGSGDNLGSHTATQDLNLAQHSVLSVASMSMVGQGLQIGTDLTSSANGLFISTAGAVMTMGAGNGTTLPNPRGIGASDLQTSRSNAADVASGAYSVIAGGTDNKASDLNAAVGGGSGNTASAWYATVSGGSGNTASGSDATVSGGTSNSVSNVGGTVSGGASNTANNYYTTVAGGLSNTAGADYSVESGGANNSAGGHYSVIPGGANNIANGDYSWAGGYKANSNGNGSFTWADNAGINVYNTAANRTLFKNQGGFIVTGSTNTNMTGALDRGVVITGSGLVGISTGVPYAALDIVSTGTASDNIYAQIWRDSTGAVVASMTVTGKIFGIGSGLTGISAAANGDSLGSHIATQTVSMAGFDLANVSTITFKANVYIASTTAANYGGLYVSTNVYFATASNIYNASTIAASGDITAARYQINGSTVLAVLPGFYSMGIGIEAGKVNAANYEFFAGYQAGRANTTGDGNSFVGYQAGYANTSGAYNAFLGAGAGAANTSGSDNTFLGGDAGNDNTAGNNNAFIGAAAGLTSTTGENNVAIGVQALRNNRTGSANLILGNSAGLGSFPTAYSSSTIIGNMAGFGLISGSDNIFLGFQAGYGVTTGAGNIVIGYNKDTSVPDANNELNIGGVLFGKLDEKTIGISTRTPAAALDIVSTDTAKDNAYAQIWRDSTGAEVASMTVTGKLYATLPNVTVDNLGNEIATTQLKMGNYAIYSSSDITAAHYMINGSTVLSVSASDNVYVGFSAGSNMTSGFYNTFVGNKAGNSNTTAIDNTFIGSETGYNTTIAGFNSFLGLQTGFANITGDNNTFIGARSGRYTQAGSANAVLGAYAGYGSSGLSFSSTTLVGSGAGYSLQTGNDNIFVGWQAGYSVTTGTGNIVIGYNIGPSAATASNEINIGGIYKGLISSGTATIGKFTVQAADAGITLTSADYGKTITVNSGSAQTVNLPSVTAADVGATITVVKLGAGKVTIVPAASTAIADSTSGTTGGIYNNAVSPAYATVTLRLVTSTQWMLMGGDGAWVTF